MQNDLKHICFVPQRLAMNIAPQKNTAVCLYFDNNCCVDKHIQYMFLSSRFQIYFDRWWKFMLYCMSVWYLVPEWYW